MVDRSEDVVIDALCGALSQHIGEDGRFLLMVFSPNGKVGPNGGGEYTVSFWGDGLSDGMSSILRHMADDIEKQHREAAGSH